MSVIDAALVRAQRQGKRRTMVLDEKPLKHLLYYTLMLFYYT